MDNKKEKISNLELLEAMSGINERYLKEADSLCVKKKNYWHMAVAVAAVIICTIIIPNINESTAYAMQKIPFVGAYFEMVTFRQYKFDDGKNDAYINLKKVKNKTEDMELEIRENADKSEEKINQDMEKKTNELIKEFRKQVGGLGYSSLKVNNSVVTNSIDYYCIKLSAFMSQADGYEVNYFYTIDKKTGQVIKLTDLFKKDSQYVDVITKDIKKQMKKKMKENSQYKYFIDEEEEYATFEKIDENQQFYINNSGELVICFAEGDVAPAYMGALEFSISHKTIKNILK